MKKIELIILRIDELSDCRIVDNLIEVDYIYMVIYPGL